MHFNVTKTVKVVDTIDVPEWLTLALNGQKIDAIKALRATIGAEDISGNKISLCHLKRIVDSVMTTTSTFTYAGEITDIELR